MEYKQKANVLALTHTSNNNNTNSRKVLCYNSWFYRRVYTWFTLFAECLLPLALMLVYNALLIRRANQSSRKLERCVEQQRRRRESHALLAKSLAIADQHRCT